MNTDRFLTRVWDKEQKEMWHSGSKYGQITNEGFYGLSGHVFIPFGDRFVPMQCTGLKDKNGNLIYEGDIITNHYIKEYPDENYIKHIVTISEGNNLTLCEYSAPECVVLGNKWENEKLLEVKA